MVTGTERQHAGLPVDVDAVRVLERGWIAGSQVGGQADQITLTKKDTVEVHVVLRGPTARDDAEGAQELVDRLWDVLRPGAQPLLQRLVLCKVPQMPAERAVHGVKPGSVDEIGDAEDLLGRQWTPFNRSREQPLHKAGAWLAPL